FLGRRPQLKPSGPLTQQLELRSPLLLGGAVAERQAVAAAHRTIAQEFGTCLVEDIAREFSEVEANPFSAEAVLRRSLQGSQFTALDGLPSGLASRTIEILYEEQETLA